jgi:hypothetical protein
MCLANSTFVLTRRPGMSWGLTRKESTSMSDDGLHYAQSKLTFPAQSGSQASCSVSLDNSASARRELPSRTLTGGPLSARRPPRGKYGRTPAAVTTGNMSTSGNRQRVHVAVPATGDGDHEGDTGRSLSSFGTGLLALADVTVGDLDRIAQLVENTGTCRSGRPIRASSPRRSVLG